MESISIDLVKDVKRLEKLAEENDHTNKNSTITRLILDDPGETSD